MTSVDGADSRTVESGRKFYSHKYKKSAFRYEVALCIKTGWIVWINGPYEAGSWPDINIFRDSLKSHLEENERVEADDGYRGDVWTCAQRCCRLHPLNDVPFKGFEQILKCKKVRNNN